MVWWTLPKKEGTVNKKTSRLRSDLTPTEVVRTVLLRIPFCREKTKKGSLIETLRGSANNGRRTFLSIKSIPTQRRKGKDLTFEELPSLK